MLLGVEAASHLVDSAAGAVGSNPAAFHEALDALPAPIYVTDHEGTVTYFNKACVDLAGRTPEVGHDKWCVTWKLFKLDGEFLPHDQCPMAVAIREKRPVRNVEAIAERPDGSRVNFLPFPTPYYDASGDFAGAVNLLLEVASEGDGDYLSQQADKCRELAAEVTDLQTSETLNLMAAKYEAQALRLYRRT